jgi:hypothetical protein
MKPQCFLYYLAAIAVLFMACEPKPEPDYRDKWVGDWDFETISTSWQMDWPQSIVDTLYFTGKIFIGDEDNQLSINYLKDHCYVIKVNEEGGFSEGGTEYVFGQFEGEDKVLIETRHGGHGGNVQETIGGTKIKKGGKK